MTLELAVSLPVWFHRSRCGRRRLSQRQDVRRRRKRFRWELDPVDTKCAENALRLQHSLHQHEDHLLKMASEVRFISFFHVDDAIPPRGSVEFAAEPAAVAGPLSRGRGRVAPHLASLSSDADSRRDSQARPLVDTSPRIRANGAGVRGVAGVATLRAGGDDERDGGGGGGHASSSGGGEGARRLAGDAVAEGEGAVGDGCRIKSPGSRPALFPSSGGDGGRGSDADFCESGSRFSAAASVVAAERGR